MSESIKGKMGSLSRMAATLVTASQDSPDAEREVILQSYRDMLALAEKIYAMTEAEAKRYLYGAGKQELDAINASIEKLFCEIDKETTATRVMRKVWASIDTLEPCNYSKN